MKIAFSLRPGRRPDEYLAAFPPGRLHYDAYFADVELQLDGQVVKLPSVPMIYFVTVLQQLLFETYITRRKARAALWDTGHDLSLQIDENKTVVLEIPEGTNPLRYPVEAFIAALRAVTLELLWTMYDDEPKLLSKRGVFGEGSVQHQVAELILFGKLPRVQ